MENNTIKRIALDGKQDHEQCVWMTENGIAMFEDITKGELYRIEFVNR